MGLNDLFQCAWLRDIYSSFHFESLKVMTIFFMVRTTLDEDEYRACAE